jgi:hypothetical protein
MTSETLKTTISIKTISSGIMLTFRYLPKVLRERRLPADASSFVPRREISSRVANTPRLAPVVVNVTIVVTVVVVTVEIMADNQTLL